MITGNRPVRGSASPPFTIFLMTGSPVSSRSYVCVRALISFGGYARFGSIPRSRTGRSDDIAIVWAVHRSGLGLPQHDSLWQLSDALRRSTPCGQLLRLSPVLHRLSTPILRRRD